jgi:phage tail sheath protein FI
MPTYLSPGVYVEEVSRGSRPIEGVGTAVAAFVGLTQKRPDDDPRDPLGMKPRHVTNWAQYQQLYGGFVDDGFLPHAVFGFFNNGGGSCYICPVGAPSAGKATPQGALPAARKTGVATLEVRALEEGAKIEVVVEPGEPAEGGEVTSFTLAVRRDGQEVEKFADLTFAKGPRNVETIVNQGSKQVRVKAPSIAGLSVAERLPTAGKYALEVKPSAKVALASKDFEGSESERTGVRGLVIAEEVTMVCVPDLVSAATKDGGFDLDLFKAVQTAVIDHCEATGDRMAILDSPPAMSPQQVKEWRAEKAMYDSKYAAFYYPWIKVASPNGGKNGARVIAVPPSGHVAGIWARNDDTRGVWKAPANEVVRGAVDLDFVITKGEQDLLNPIGINCIRPFGIRGIRVWGARTLSSDAEWRYVNVRRLFNYIEESILNGTQWVVFEPNDLDLWERVKRTIKAFLIGLWRQGALFGATPEQAFYVKCDEETNPPESIDEGKLVVEVGVAPVKPAEFVIFRISQWQGGGGAAE